MREVLAKELILDNFKSFGKKTVIPLMEGFTTISGPNGSGKSNTLDSILFCLGLSSSKGLRAERLPDLINNKSSRNEARVTLKLEVKGQSDLVEISRVVKVGKTDYSSTYYLDGKPVSLQVIHDKLLDLNISPNGHNIIMQGDVTRILTMGPVERRKIIDDLAGVGEFDERIESAKKEMGEAERHMDATRILSTELTMRLDALKMEREQALAYIAIRKEKERLEKTMLVRRHTDSSRVLEALRKKLTGLQKEYSEKNEEMLGLEKSMAAGKERFMALDREIQEISDKDRMGGFSELEEIKEKLHRSTSLIEYVEKMSQEHAKRQEELQVKYTEAGQRRDELGELLRTDAVERQKLEAQLATKREAMMNLSNRMHSTNEANTRSISDLPTLRKQLEESKDLASQLEFAEAKLNNEAINYEGTQAKVRIDAERIAGLLATAKATQKKKNEELKAASAKTQELNYELVDSRQVIKERKARLFELQETYQRALQQYSKLEGMKQAADQGGMGALSTVLNSGIKGILGRVADLAEIPEAYRVALESAAGRRFDFVVVQNENVAVEAIDLLKQRKMGRVTFLPLNKIRGVTLDAAPRANGIIGWALDLIKYEPKYKDIFGFVVGDTLVIDRIQTGLNIMGRYRMVSLEGDLLEKTGAMTGGSAPAPRRQMGELDLAGKKRALDAMEAEARAIRNELPQLEEKIQHLEEALQNARRIEMDLNSELGHLAREVERLNTENTAAQGQLEIAVKGLARIAREREAFAREKQRIAEQVRQKQDALSHAETTLTQSVSKELSEELKFLDGQIHEISEALRVVKDRIREREIELDFHKKNIELCRKEYDEIAEKVATLGDQVVQNRAEQDVLRVRHTELTKALEAVAIKLGEKRKEREDEAAKLEQHTARRDELKVELVRKETELNEGRARELQLSEDVTKMAQDLEAQQINPEEYPWKGSVKELEQSIAGLAGQLNDMGAVNLLAIDQAKELEERLGQLQEKLDTLERERQDILARMAGFAELKREAFMKTYGGVRQSFQRIYSDLSGGQGDLVLESEIDPFAGGLVIRACPKGKDMKRMEALSGGEKSLAALGFVFSWQTFRPAPFYIFDEVDMFLDNPNTERLGNMIKRQSDNTQFIVVSLKRCMVEKSHRTVGVYAKEGGFSQVAGVDMSTLEGPGASDVGNAAGDSTAAAAAN